MLLKQLFVTTIAATLACSIGQADQGKAKITIPVTRTAATNGKQMYVNYCAPCHGMDGKGQGPVAPSLKTAPTDLTVLSRNNHGRFLDTHVVAVLQNGIDIPSHGTAEMPVWGPILGKLNRQNTQDRMLRVSNLVRFLDSLQTK
ncbi:MAG: cytochrome c [Terracidiphilus sp.]